MSFFTKLPEELYDHTAFDGFEIVEGFSAAAGKAMAWMSQLAYETDQPDKIERILADWDLHLVGLPAAKLGTFFFSAADTHGVVAAGRGAVIVALAGTDPLVIANWRTDLHVLRNPTTDVAIGYQEAADSIFPQVESLLRGVATQDSPIYVTGHSLGGALAVVLARRLRESAYPVHAVYTIGMPRAGGASFSAQYDALLGQHTHRLVHGEDIVPTVAPGYLGFLHVGLYRHCGRGGRFAEGTCPSGCDDPEFSKAAWHDIQSMLRRPLLFIGAAGQRVWVAVRSMFGMPPRGGRTDLGGIAIELLPPRLRDHMPDRYIGAFRKDGA